MCILEWDTETFYDIATYSFLRRGFSTFVPSFFSPGEPLAKPYFVAPSKEENNVQSEIEGQIQTDS